MNLDNYKRRGKEFVVDEKGGLLDCPSNVEVLVIPEGVTTITPYFFLTEVNMMKFTALTHSKILKLVLLGILVMLRIQQPKKLSWKLPTNHSTSCKNRG